VITFGSLFAGIGGFDLGFHRAGLRCAWQVEIDPDARGVLARHWPDVPRFEDVRAVGGADLPPVDVVCGGFPCQDLSVAGKRAGLAAKRSGLFYEMTRVVDELKPSYLIFENVPGLLSSRSGRDFLAVLLELDRVGYSGCWTTLDSQFFGLAQRRRRVFGVFTRLRAGAVRCAEILSLATRCGGHPAPGGAAGAGTAGTLGGGTAGQGWRCGSDEAAAGQLVAFSHTQGLDAQPSVSARPTLRGEGGGHAVAYQCHGGNVGPMGVLRQGNGSLTGGVPFIVNAAESCATKSHARETDTARSLDTTGGFASSQGGTVIGVQMNFIRETRLRDLAGTLASQPGNAQFNGLFDQGRMAVRRLTPVECERLQGFPDGWTAGFADGARYRMLGNAVSVPPAEWIGRRTVAAHGEGQA
jgi:DNA (cytosine-5)-methyltransferase 1